MASAYTHHVKIVAGCDCIISRLEDRLIFERLVPVLADHETPSCRVQLVKVDDVEDNQVMYGVRSNYSEEVLTHLVVYGIRRFVEFKGYSCSCKPIKSTRLTLFFTKAMGSAQIPLCFPQQVAVGS